MWIRLLLLISAVNLAACHDFDEQHHVELHQENNRLHKQVQKYKNHENDGHNHNHRPKPKPQPQNIQLVRKACIQNAYSLGGQLVPGKTLVVYGKTEWDRTAFSFNLVDIFAEVPMHMSICFSGGCEQPYVNKIGFDSYRNGKWIKKTAHVPNQFWPNTPFVVEIKVENYTYELYVNGIRVYSFAHRSSVNELNGFAFCGVDVTSVQLR